MSKDASLVVEGKLLRFVGVLPINPKIMVDQILCRGCHGTRGQLGPWRRGKTFIDVDKLVVQKLELAIDGLFRDGQDHVMLGQRAWRGRFQIGHVWQTRRVAACCESERVTIIARESLE